MDRRYVGGIAVAIAVTVMGWQAFIIYQARSEPTEGLPTDRDPNMVGRWWADQAPGHRVPPDEQRRTIEILFSADGTGQSAKSFGKGHRPFRWGTRGGVLYARYLSVDYWAMVIYPYTFSKGDSVLKIKGAASDYRPFRETLRRR